MSSTSVHFPKGVLEEIDRRAAEEGVSRNKFIVRSCRTALEAGRSQWPPGFFADEHLTPAVLEELHESASTFEESIRDARQNRKTPPFS